MGSISGNSGALGALGADEPREIAGYRLLARIGEGGMGSVYLSCTRGKQPVALKVIRREFADDAEFRRRFQHEVRAAQQVRGYHLVPVMDHDAGGRQPWLATAYVPGMPLDEVLAAFGPLPVPAALELVGCVARGLASVHAAGVVHRDLKPANILLGADGPWVIDFGIARAAESTQLTRSGGFIGTPQFMSPEHGTGAEVTAAADVFSLGLIAAVAATGRHPYGSGGALTVATQIANTELRPPDLTGYPEQLRPLLERTVIADPAVRATPSELAELCERSLGRALKPGEGWLPGPVTAAVAERGREAERLLAGAPAHPASVPQVSVPPVSVASAAGADGGAATYVPTQVASRPGDDVHSAPTQAAPPAPAAPPAAAAGRPPRRRTPMAVALVAALAVIAAGTAWFLSGDDKSGTTGATGAPTTTASAPSAAATAAATAAPGTRPADAPPAAASATAASKGGYEPVFADRPLLVGPPVIGAVITVDLDTPKVVPNGDLGDHQADFYYLLQLMHFRTPMAKSPGTSPEQCRQSVDTAPLPAELSNTALIDQKALKKGDVLCTVTDKGNLAMLKLTDVKPTGQPFDPPAYSFLLSLWKPAG
ncbi:serine/threonine-protein kinase [Kitasatospora sp. NPDC059648]|uniref:serine/threonine-protein kinase n=1 Tax=Kitasatospora sp. NPDC059648 TaxID=3346894 RepID=UPI0036B65349